VASSLAVGGLSSGIDTKAIVDVLINADRAPARLAEKNKSVAQGRLEAIKAMNTRLVALRDAMDEVEQKSIFGGKKVSSSNETAVTATATTEAVAGSMTINVKKLATAHQVATKGVTSSTADLGEGTILLRLASTPPGDADIVITPTTNTLTGIAAAINAAKKGISATVVNDGGTNPYRLVITSTSTGAANAITKLEGTGTDDELTDGFEDILPGLEDKVIPAIPPDPEDPEDPGTPEVIIPTTMTTVTAASDAEVRLGNKDTGLLLKSATNVMDAAIPGLSMTLKTVADGVTISIEQDAASVRGKVQKMADAFNEALSFYNNNARYDSGTKTAGRLFSDYDLRNQIDAVGRELSKTFASQPSGFRSLAEIGVTIGGDGKLSIKAETFDAKLAENQQAVSELFLAASTAGSAPIERLTRSVTGSIATKQTTIEGSIKAFDERITAIDARLERRKAYYQAKFAQMEKLTAQFQSQSSSLTNFVNGLSSSKK
jgi:flagellar hook-associated protein 2